MLHHAEVQLLCSLILIMPRKKKERQFMTYDANPERQLADYTISAEFDPSELPLTTACQQ